MVNTKKIWSLIIFILLFFVLIGCGNNADNQEKLYKALLHYDEEIKEVDVKAGSTIDFANPDPDNYILIDWYEEEGFINVATGKTINNDIEIYGKVVLKGTEYKITYDLDGGTFNAGHPNKYQCGEETILTNPIKNKYYNFLGWDYNGKIIDKISSDMYGDITVKAKWEDVAKYYNVNYVLGDGSLKEEPLKILRQGDEYTLPIPDTKDEKTYFWGWYTDMEFKNRVKVLDEETINSDVTLYAQYGGRNAENTYISFLGDSITTFPGYIPTGFESYYRQGDVRTVNDTWWYQVTTKLGYNLCMNNSYSGSKVLGGVMEASSLERIKYLGNEEHKPDIVVIYMGTNDWAAGTSKADFKAAYKKMLDLIYQEFGSETTIYVATLPTNDYSEGFQKLRRDNNAAIKELASDYNLVVLDLEKAITSVNLEACTYSGCHPNKYGMTVMADYIYPIIKEAEDAKLAAK